MWMAPAALGRRVGHGWSGTALACGTFLLAQEGAPLSGRTNAGPSFRTEDTSENGHGTQQLRGRGLEIAHHRLGQGRVGACGSALPNWTVAGLYSRARLA